MLPNRASCCHLLCARTYATIKVNTLTERIVNVMLIGNVIKLPRSIPRARQTVSFIMLKLSNFMYESYFIFQ